MKFTTLIILILFSTTIFTYDKGKNPSSMTETEFVNLETKIKQQIKQKPENKEYLVKLAHLYLINSKYRKAVKAYQEAIIVDPKDSKLFAGIAMSYIHLGQYKMAKMMANEALAIDPKFEHASKLITYINRKQELLRNAQESDKINKEK